MCPLASGFDRTTVVLCILCAGSSLSATVVLFVFIAVWVLSWVLVNCFLPPVCMTFALSV